MNHRAIPQSAVAPLGAALARALRDRGVSHVFTIPGDFVLPLVAAIERDQILPLVALSHEPALAFAADAAARVTRRPAAVLVTYGAGALNLVNAVANAYLEMSPLVVIAGAPSPAELAPGRVIHHQARAIDSQRRVFEEVTCAQAILDDPATASDAIARVLDACVARSRPVYIEVPRDLGAVPIGPVPAASAAITPGAALAAAVDLVLRAVAAAPRVAILAGAEVRRRDLDRAVASLAHHLGAPLATSFMGRGVASDIPGSPLVGVWHGVAGAPDALDALDAADLVLRIGVIPSDSNLGPIAAEAARASRVVAAHDDTVVFAGRHLAGVPLAALVDAVLAALSAVPPRAPWHRRREPTSPGRLRPPQPTDDALAPNDVAAALNVAFARHGAPPLVCDTGDALFLASRVDHGALIAPSCYATMGFAVPAALGVQLATGARPIALVGDGAFQMTGLELAACARLGCDPIVVVLNNASWETIRVFYPDGGASTASPLHALEVHDCAAIARALGGVGRVVSTPGELGAGLEDALTSRGRFYLLDVRLPRGVVTSTLHRFAGMLRAEPTGEDAARSAVALTAR